MQGYVSYLPPRYFAPAYFGRRYFAFAIPAHHVITVGEAARQIVVAVQGAAPGLPDVGRQVSVPAVRRTVGVQAVRRTVAAQVPIQEVTV